MKVRKIGRVRPFSRRAMQALAVVPAVLFLFLVTLAASPALHQAIHADAGHSDHHCAITVLAQSQLESPPTVTFLLIAAKEVANTLPVPLSVPGGGAELLPPGRAPPSIFA